MEVAGKHPMLFALAILLSFVLLHDAVWLALRNLASETLTHQAKDLDGVIIDTQVHDAN
jgi:hypothetical protein